MVWYVLGGAEFTCCAAGDNGADELYVYKDACLGFDKGRPSRASAAVYIYRGLFWLASKGERRETRVNFKAIPLDAPRLLHTTRTFHPRARMSPLLNNHAQFQKG